MKSRANRKQVQSPPGGASSVPGRPRLLAMRRGCIGTDCPRCGSGQPDPPGPRRRIPGSAARLARIKQTGVLRVGMGPTRSALINDRKQEDGFDFRAGSSPALGARR
jgi:hypothetical protein